MISEDHDGASIQIFGYLIEVPEQSCCLVLRVAIALTEQHQTWQSQSLPGENLAEVRVGRHEDAFLVPRCGQHFFIEVAGKVAVEDVDDAVSGFGKVRGKASADALVEEKPHAVVVSGTCRSLTAWAANSSAARTSSVDSCG